MFKCHVREGSDISKLGHGSHFVVFRGGNVMVDLLSLAYGTSLAKAISGGISNGDNRNALYDKHYPLCFIIKSTAMYSGIYDETL